jgi:hypothetical protein
LGSLNLDIGSSKVAPPGRLRGADKKTRPTTKSGCVSKRRRLGLRLKTEPDYSRRAEKNFCAQDGRDELAERCGELRGPLKRAPISSECQHLAPALISFVKQHLRIAVSLELDDRFADVVSSGFAPRPTGGFRRAWA